LLTITSMKNHVTHCCGNSVDPFVWTSRTWFLDWQLSKTYHMIEDGEPILERTIGYIWWTPFPFLLFCLAWFIKATAVYDTTWISETSHELSKEVLTSPTLASTSVCQPIRTILNNWTIENTFCHHLSGLLSSL
jgi:hypothetical protein